MHRRAVLDRLTATVAAGRPVIGAGAGTGLSAKAAESGGVDLLIIYNSGRYRMAGRGSLAGLLPYGDANAIVVEMAGEVLPVVRDTPVLAGVCGTDPFRLMDPFLDELRRLGFSGVQNFPTVGLYDGTFREHLEQTGMGFGLEVDMIRLAADEGPAHRAVRVRPRPGGGDGRGRVRTSWSRTSGSPAAARSARRARSPWTQAAAAVQAMRDAAVAVNRDILVLCHGGPIAEPEDAQYVLDHTEGIAGFFGASSVERLPTEVAVRTQAEAFKSLRV